jgi:hypothetical protein
MAKVEVDHKFLISGPRLPFTKLWKRTRRRVAVPARTRTSKRWKKLPKRSSTS